MPILEARWVLLALASEEHSNTAPSLENIYTKWEDFPSCTPPSPGDEKPRDSPLAGGGVLSSPESVADLGSCGDQLSNVPEVEVTT